MPNGRIALFNGQTNRDMRVLTQTLPALAKGSLPLRLAIPEKCFGYPLKAGQFQGFSVKECLQSKYR